MIPKRLIASASKSAQFPGLAKRSIRKFYKEVTISKCDPPENFEDKEYAASVSDVDWNISKSDQYYQINLDKFKGKTVYKDPLIIPSYPLAVALAEEWASQPWSEKSNYLNQRPMRLNTIMAQAYLTSIDKDLRTHQENTIVEVLGTDQVGFREKSKNRESYKTLLRNEQIDRSSALIDFMYEKYNIELKTFDDFSYLKQDPSYLKIKELVTELDPYLLHGLFTISLSTKSTVIALALLNEFISFEDAILMSRLEEIFQQKSFGVVEGAHDYDESRTISDIAAAKGFVNLCQKDI